MISAIIPTYRNPICLDICLDSALKGMSETTTEIICIVDGFVDESEEIISKYKGQVKFLKLDENCGMQRALNIGVMNASGDTIFIVNDDNVFPEQWDTLLHRQMQLDWVDIVTVNQIERTESIFGFHVADYGSPETFNYDAFVAGEKDFREDRFTTKGSIFPFAMSKRNYMMLGGFDEMYPSPFVCDWDFFLKCDLAGLESIRTYRLSMYHFGSVATKNSAEADKFAEGELQAAGTFQYKWGFDPLVNPDDYSRTPKGKTIKGISYD
jgi:glycosyltransferase involved in cell wall biosynthesis